MEKGNVNLPALAASLLMAVTFVVHVFVGGPELYGPVRASNMSAIERSSFSVIWHFTSLQLFLQSVVLFHLARFQNQALWLYAIATSAGFALLFLGYGLFDLGGILLMPQWIAFLGTLALLLWGRRHSLHPKSKHPV